MKNTKNNGITLIALVITIIVLLILAGVSIATLTGDSGIVTQAQKAENKTKEAAKNENYILKDYEDMLNGITMQYNVSHDEYLNNINSLSQISTVSLLSNNNDNNEIKWYNIK